ncbi:hypothetical protein EV368DRAFT_88715 [Lentinula lateritia]|nr:hypothetical protein EV368DRAFT_88715 [Lentinula lateritia]
MSDPLRCAPECKRGPFPLAQATNRHRGCCATWNAHITAQALKPGYEEVSGEVEDPAITHQKRQKCKKLKNVLAEGSHPQSSIITVNSIQVTASSSAVTLEQSGESRVLETPGHITPRVLLTPEPNMFNAGIDGHPNGSEPVPTEMTAAGRPICSSHGHLPARYLDVLPQSAPTVRSLQVKNEVQPTEQCTSTHTLPHIILIIRDKLKTQLNIFGLWCEYLDRPSHDPDGEVGLEDLSNLPHSEEHQDNEHSESENSRDDSPLNPTQTLLAGWQNNGNSTKSNSEMDGLTHILQRPDFQVKKLEGYNTQAANEKISKADEDWGHNQFKDSFVETAVEIEVPSGDPQIPSKKFQIPQLLYQNPLSVICAAFADRLASQFHFVPFKLFQEIDSNDGKTISQRVQTDLYNSDVFLEEHKNLRCAPTDAMQLANFGTAKLWPIYMLFGNLSKYVCASPNSGAIHHLAYIPTIPDSVKHEISKFNINWKTQAKEIIAHCNRELYHAVWRFLLNDVFLHAYKYGIVIKCFDGVECRVYPQFFTYFADYPEKVLLATICERGLCPCPHCLCPKEALDWMGLHQDMKMCDKLWVFLHNKVKLTREWIYNQGVKIQGSAVQHILKATSSVPTMNAFIGCLGLDFNLSHMLVVDLMHEFELGVWKALFSHLIQILYAVGQQYVEELNHRSLKSRTANFFISEALLAKVRMVSKPKCAIPVFEGLLPGPVNSKLMTLLYRAAEWHALAKLRMHTEKTLDYMETLTYEFGKLMHQFQDLSNNSFQTYKTDRETTTHYCQKEKEAIAAGATDYVCSICWFGPTDSFSTQLGKLAHRVVKKLYGLGNKKKDPRQIGCRLCRLEWARCAADHRGIHTKRRRQQGILNAGNAAELLAAHHHIGLSAKNKHNIGSFVKMHHDDPAAQNFHPKLQDHLLGRLMDCKFDGDTHESFTDADRNHIRLKGGSFISLKTCRINYTTYDIRRDQDTINPSNHADVRMQQELIHTGMPVFLEYFAPLLFRVILTPVQQNPDQWKWSSFGFAGLVGLVPESDPFAFGFLDPAHIIRGCHLMPVFSDGQTLELLETKKPMVAQKEGEKDDWAYFYVGIFVDRDMFMRYFPGGGVGHVANRKFFKQVEDSSNDDAVSDISSDPGADELEIPDTEEVDLEDVREWF